METVEWERAQAVIATRTMKVLESIGFSAWAASEMDLAYQYLSFGLLSTLSGERILSFCKSICDKGDGLHDNLQYEENGTSSLLAGYGPHVPKVAENNLLVLMDFFQYVRCMSLDPPDMATLTLDNIWNLAYYHRYMVPEFQYNEMKWSAMLSVLYETINCGNGKFVPLHLLDPVAIAVGDPVKQDTWQKIVKVTCHRSGWKLLQLNVHDAPKPRCGN
jgi:hypothetical protein